MNAIYSNDLIFLLCSNTSHNILSIKSMQLSINEITIIIGCCKWTIKSLLAFLFVAFTRLSQVQYGRLVNTLMDPLVSRHDRYR